MWGEKKEKEKHFNLLAVNMPTAAGARTLSLEGGATEKRSGIIINLKVILNDIQKLK